MRAKLGQGSETANGPKVVEMLLGKVPILLFPVVMICLLGRQTVGAGERFIQDRFAVGLWSDPPADQEMERRYREIAEANFTFVIGIFGSTTAPTIEKELAYCEKFGLKAIISMAGQPPDR